MTVIGEASAGALAARAKSEQHGALASSPRVAQSQQSQSNRRQWDAAWLDEPGLACTAVEPSARTELARETNASVKTPLPPIDLLNAVAQPRASASRPENVADTRAHTSCAKGPSPMKAAPLPSEPVVLRSEPKAATTPASGAAVSDSGRTQQGAALSDSAPLQSAAMSAHDLSRAAALGNLRKHFALWRDGDSVEFAMRTSQPEQARTTIGVLRDWLHAAGLTLRKVWVNGTIRD
jgi:hypothetical protein